MAFLKKRKETCIDDEEIAAESAVHVCLHVHITCAGCTLDACM